MVKGTCSVAQGLSKFSRVSRRREPVAPMAYQVFLEPGIIGQFREFESPCVHTRINSWGLLQCAQIDSRKAREREFYQQHSMKNRRAAGLLKP